MSAAGSHTPGLSLGPSPGVVPSGSTRWISSLPSSVLCWCLTPFLTDLEAIAVAACSKESLDAMQRAPYYIKTRLWWLNDDMFASLAPTSWAKSGAGVWLTSSPQFRIGQLRRAFVDDTDALRLTSLIAALPKSVDELAVESCKLPAVVPLNAVVYPVQLTSLLLDTIRLPDNAAPLALPPNLRTLALPSCPDHIRWQDVIPVLPESLRTLRLHDFALNRSLKEFILPPHLTELNMGEWMGPIAELPLLPTGLRTLVFPSQVEGVCDLVKWLPSSVTELFFDQCVDDNLDDVEWPPSLRAMRLVCEESLLNWRPPPALETLDLLWSLPWGVHLSLSSLRLPATLQRLDLRGFQGPIDASYCWPPTLRALHLESVRRPLSDVQWPASLEELELSVWNLPSHQLRLPPRLRKLRLGNEFNKSVAELELPSTLEWLGFGDSFNQPVEGVLRLPMQLQQLHFGSGTNTDKFNQPLTNMQWPSSLQSLFLPPSLKLPLEGLPRLLPASLRALHRFESGDANIESGWIAIVAALPRCEMILHPPRNSNPDPQQISFELFK